MNPHTRLGVANNCILVLILSILIMTGCSRKKGPEDVLRENARAMQAEDLEAVLKTMDANRESMRNAVLKLFSKYDLDYELEKIEPLELKDHFARFRVVLVTRKRAGPEFRDNRITFIQILIKNDDEWRISDATQEKLEYLN